MIVVKKQYLMAVLLACVAISDPVLADGSPVGVWRTYDDNDGLPASLVQIEDKNSVLDARIIKLLPRPGHDVNAKCVNCDGENRNQPITGMRIMWDMKQNGDEFSGGKIFDPDSGKTYGCKLKVVGDKLNVRGFLGMALFGRTQVWEREK